MSTEPEPPGNGWRFWLLFVLLMILAVLIVRVLVPVRDM